MSAESATPERGYSAFISHASADHAAAETIAASLESKGLTCWIAPRDIRPGGEYGEEILRGIEQSKVFVLVLSEAANLSAHVRREVERAASKGKPIFPVRIEEVPPSPKLEYFVSMQHWLDAWDGVLADHAGRLAAAIESDEEWIGNRLLARRRQRRIGAGLGLALAVVAVVAGFVFSSDIRNLFQSDQQRAIAALAAKGIPVSADGLSRALNSASIEDIRLLETAGITPQQLNEAFAQSAAGFFDKSRGVPEATDWLKQTLKDHLDPNLLAPHDHYGSEAIFASAVRSGNAAAAVALTEAGASPHAYEGLFLSPYDVPRFLFPLTSVLSNETMTPEEKSAVAKAMQDAGAVIMPLDKSGYQVDAVNQVLASAPSAFGFPISETPSACGGRKETPICATARARTGRDWCDFMAKLPVRIRWREGESHDSRLLSFDLQSLLAVVDNKAYVLATDTVDFGEPYLLVEIAADERTWTVYRFTGPGVGLGHCKPLVDGGESDDCWRRWSVVYDPEKSIARVEDYYDYAALSSCEPEETQ